MHQAIFLTRESVAAVGGDGAAQKRQHVLVDARDVERALAGAPDRVRRERDAAHDARHGVLAQAPRRRDRRGVEERAVAPGVGDHIVAVAVDDQHRAAAHLGARPLDRVVLHRAQRAQQPVRQGADEARPVGFGQAEVVLLDVPIVPANSLWIEKGIKMNVWWRGRAYI